ncbi:MAG: NAD(P)/FAD-dependent oxidoreductase, partial [Thermomicrobiales bacterium]
MARGRSSPLSAATELKQPIKLEPVRTRAGRPRVVIIGGGFGGLTAARSLKDAPVEITLIDRRNHHLFQPLLYQVATASLSPADIAQPIREILRKQKNVKVQLDEVTGVDPEAKEVRLATGETVAFDYLVMAAGARHSYFGRDEWEKDAPGMKSLDEALDIRSKILLSFEQAEVAETESERRALLTFVVIGGGPTGVELAGAIAEIAHHSVAHDFRNFDPSTAKVILLEALPKILPMFPEKLSASAVKQLTEMGVTVRTGGMVTLIEPGVVHLGEDSIHANTIIWA